MKRGLLIVISGPSGVGKGTVREKLFSEGNHGLVYSISMTTRLARPTEQNGVDYYFVSKEEFMDRVEDGKMLEWAEFVNNYYGTPLDYVEELRNQGKNVVLEIEVQGAMQVREKVEDAVFIFLAPPSLEELRNRIINRGTESLEKINARLEKGAKEMGLQSEYDHVVVNDTVDNAVAQILEIIDNEINKEGM